MDDRKETEQLPITKDLHHLASTKYARDIFLSNIRDQHNDSDENELMNGVEVEVSDTEKHVAHRSIRRSVVSKEKLNWSC